MTAETSTIVAEIAGRYLHFGEADLVQALATDRGKLVTDIRALAGSALRQREADPGPVNNAAEIRRLCAAGTEAHGDEFYGPILEALDREGPVHDEGSGLRVNLIDVFAAWGESEARDTAMLIDLCMGAALEQLVPFTVPAAMWPAEVQITGKALDRLAATGRIIRLRAEPDRWHVRLLPPAEDEDREVNERWGDLGWIRRHLQAFTDYHAVQATLAAGADGVEFHTEREDLGRKLLAGMQNYGGAVDPPRDKLPGENAPENEIAESPEPVAFSGSSEKLDSQDGFDTKGS